MSLTTITRLLKESLSRTRIREVDDVEARNIRRGGCKPFKNTQKKIRNKKHTIWQWNKHGAGMAQQTR